MFEVRPIGTRTKFKPVKKPESEIPLVEFVAELFEVELEELRFYVMVSVQYAPLGVADDNVYPWQDFNLTRDGRSLENADNLHLYMPDTLGRRRLWQAAFRHDKDRGLALAFPSAFQRAIFQFFGCFRGEEALCLLLSVCIRLVLCPPYQDVRFPHWRT